MKIYAVLVAYNPEVGEIENAVSRLLTQTDFVVIGNNSNNNLDINSSKVKIFNFGENLGIAEAQSITMKWAFENGADFIIQMDQDSILQPNTVAKLLTSYEHLSKSGMKIGVIGPRHYDKVTNEIDEARLIKGDLIPNTNCTLINATISSASIIPKAAYDCVGGMEDGLFIDSVDWEYCWRLKKHGWLTVRDNDVLLGHRVGNGKKKILGKLDARIPSPIRHYYHIRNLFLLLPRGYVPLYWKLSNLAKLIIKLVLYPFIFEDGKIRLKYMLQGIKDGILRKYGRIDKASRL